MLFRSSIRQIAIIRFHSDQSGSPEHPLVFILTCVWILQDDAAVATPLGLYLNCASAGLYMANYQLVIPTVSRFLQHMGADLSAAGLVIGCCDIASIPVTVGEVSPL